MKSYRKVVTRIFDEWVYKLGLENWSMILVFVDEIEDASGPDVVAKCWKDWKYQTARVAVKKSLIKQQTEKQIERILVHELNHCLVDEMKNAHLDTDHEERVVTNLTNAFIWTKNGVKKE